MKRAFFSAILICLAAIAVFAEDSGINRNTAVKATVLSLFSGSAKITIELNTFDRQSLELTAGLIGAGIDILHDSAPHGWLARIAYKFIFRPENFSGSSLDGFYLKPELAYSSFDYNYSGAAAVERLHTDRLAVMGCFGWQFVVDPFVLDIFAGAGGAFGDSNLNNYYHGFIGLDAESPTAFTAGFKAGIVF